MTRVGLVDLSTSHPGIFAPILATLDLPVRAVLDADRGPVFCRDHPGAVPVVDMAALAGACDVAMLLGPDWDTRLPQIRTLAAHGVPVFVDKPMAGTAGELRALAELADGPARLDGGSALRVAPEAVGLRGSRVDGLSVTCAGHPFYYGVHAVALATAVLGPGLVAARGLAGDPERSITGVVEHADGTEVQVSVAIADRAGGFVATVDTGAETLRIEPAADAFYLALLRDTMTRLAGDGDTRPGGELVECELALLAMAWSLANDGTRVALDAVPADFHPWLGRALRR
jgi:hypothetical protein